ncbi:hypothetical protein PIROE2DRAFT_6792 [Piromyces sp. E2]|nr:hypothetical protein PIROE2DRAFT_6792 [Piromyces sp. E2]|eukprot:OUM66080.1 hypothetical protein PIROE2DRAFT_6792 [Piromyces sp. E2]
MIIIIVTFSAGEDIDIIVLDTSFNFDYFEFQNYSNRTTICRAYITENSEVVVLPHASQCGYLTHTHGQVVADMAGGDKSGAAKNANIYGVAIPESDGEKKYIYLKDVLPALNYILKYMIRPHKTIINISHTFLLKKNTSDYNKYEEVINNIVKKGAIVVACAGNDNMDVEFNTSDSLNKKDGKKTVPCTFDSTICVGGIDSQQISDYNNLFIM